MEKKEKLTDEKIEPVTGGVNDCASQNTYEPETAKTWVFDIGVTDPNGGGGQQQRKS